MRINLVVVWWKGTRGLQVDGCQPTCIHRRPEITSEFPVLNPTWTSHICTALFPSLFLLASSAMQGINSAADVIFHLQHSYSLQDHLLGAPLKETSQGWNCARTHKDCLLPYYFYSIRFLATIAYFWEWTKWQSRTSLLILFSSEELRRAVPHATSCLLVLFCKEVRGIVCICCCALLFMGEQEVLLALMLLYFSYSHSTHIQGEGYENVWEEKHY